MRKKSVNRLVVNWAASFLSVILLLSMVAAPALALVAANSVNSSSIVDGSIGTRDIKRNAINTSRIRDYSIRKEDIHSASINKYKLTSGAVNTYKILDGTIKNADISNSAAIADSKISYSQKTRYLAVGSGSWAHENDAGAILQDAAIYSTTGSRIIRGVNLPDGATVTTVTVYYVDTDGSNDAGVALFGKRVSDNGWFWGSGPNWIESSGSSGRGSQARGGIGLQIDNRANTYALHAITTASNKYIENIIIEYTVSGP